MVPQVQVFTIQHDSGWGAQPWLSHPDADHEERTPAPVEEVSASSWEAAGGSLANGSFFFFFMFMLIIFAMIH